MSKVGLDVILFDFSLHVFVLSYLVHSDIVALEGTCKLFQAQIRSCDPLWNAIARQLLCGKHFVNPVVNDLLFEGNRKEHRTDLMNLSIRELKLRAAKYALNISHCFEKVDIANVIATREHKKKLSGECLGRFAIRIAVIDSTRNCITEKELCSLEWNMRVRGDGPLHQFVEHDPWWSYGETTTVATFSTGGELSFKFTGPSPFQMMMQRYNMPEDAGVIGTYALDRSGNNVNLSFGVTERIARHPKHWGWVMMSSGSVWTSFPMAKRGTDEFMQTDELVDKLLKRELNYGFII